MEIFYRLGQNNNKNDAHGNFRNKPNYYNILLKKKNKGKFRKYAILHMASEFQHPTHRVSIKGQEARMSFNHNGEMKRGIRNRTKWINHIANKQRDDKEDASNIWIICTFSASTTTMRRPSISWSDNLVNRTRAHLLWIGSIILEDVLQARAKRVEFEYISIVRLKACCAPDVMLTHVQSIVNNHPKLERLSKCNKSKQQVANQEHINRQKKYVHDIRSNMQEQKKKVFNYKKEVPRLKMLTCQLHPILLFCASQGVV